jgi:EAL and modified HD-GYP domain-containing signal transduction protein
VLVDTYFARQPILDANRIVRAYEVLYRPGPKALTAGNPDGLSATASVLAGAFSDVEISDLLSGLPGYVNLPAEFLLDRSLLAFPPERVAAEILEDVEANGEVIAALKELRSLGYKVALDDFQLGDGRNELLPYCDVVKVDVLELDTVELERTARVLRSIDVTMLAEKVETIADFERSRKFGFELFQGFFFARPELVAARRLDEGRGRLIALLAELHSPDLDIDRVGRAVETHPSLAYQLLRVLNSSSVGLSRRVESIREAVVLLGARKVTELASVLVLAAQDHKPIELVSLGLTRARMCELMAREMGRRDSTSFFTVGIFSVLDALADQPMSDVVRLLPLADDIIQALVNRAGVKGEVLESAIAYERAEWERLPDVGVNARSLSLAYLDAIDYSSSMLQLARR